MTLLRGASPVAVSDKAIQGLHAARRGMRRALLAGTALTGVSLALLVALPAGAMLLLGLSSPALAAGGRGGDGPLSSGGAGGTGPFEGTDGGIGTDGGDSGNTFAGGAGGGGGGAGGGAGGNGGDGGDGTSIGTGGDGGGGGSVAGEAGENGDDGTVVMNGGGGGGGGGAHGFTGAALPGGVLTGGNGGNGGNALFPASNGGGGGGEGGYGAYVIGGGVNTNTSSITGGTGGNGGSSGGFGGSGGAGGIGVFFGAPATLINSGSISGGAGGIPGGSSFNIFGDEGQGGAGVAGSDLTIINNGTISGGLGSDGVRANAVTFTGGNNFLTFGGSTSGLTGNIAVTGSLTLDQGNGVETTVANAITGTGSVSKSGADTLTLSGNNTYTGNTTIDAGTLFVNGALTNSATTVNLGGTFGGNGSVRSVSVNGGVFAPGNGTPTSAPMTVNGTLDFAGGGIYRVFVDQTTASSANVTGTATLTGGTVNAVFSPGAYVAKQYAILETAGLGNTKFDPAVVATDLPANFHVDLSYDADTVYLDLALSFAVPGGLNGNQQAVANAVTGFFDSTGSIPIAFTALTPDQLSQAAGEVGTAPTQASFVATNMFMNLLLDPFNSGHLGSGGGASGFADETPAIGRDAAQAYAAVTPKDRLPVKAPFGRRWSVWASGYGGSASIDGDAAAGSHDTTSRIYGMAAGADRRLSPDTLVGFALGGAGFNFDLADGLGGGSADLFQAGVHGRHRFGNAYVAGALAYAWQDVKTDRTVTIAGTDKLEADFDAHIFAARGEAGYRFATAGAGVTPYGALQVTSFHQPSYAERATPGGDQFALSYASQTTTNWRTELGARFDKSFLLAEGVFTLRGRLAWAHDSDTGRGASAAFQALPGAVFTVNGAEPAADSALVSAGAELRWASGLSLGADFESEFSATTETYAGKARLSYAW